MLHAALDFRRVLDVPGYRPVPLDDAARFIGTMNYGYAAQALARLPAPQDRNEGESLRGCWWARALDQPHRESSREKAVLDQLEFPQTWSGDQVRQGMVRLPGVSFLAQTVSRLIQGRLTAGDRL